MPQPAGMFTLPPELKAKGQQAEADFRDWLNRSGVGYMYVEHSPLHVPERLRGRINWPDYLVGIPHAGTPAFDDCADFTKLGQRFQQVADRHFAKSRTTDPIEFRLPCCCYGRLISVISPPVKSVGAFRFRMLSPSSVIRCAL
jgi:hypothetical protein